jgi:hypothetical protein
MDSPKPSHRANEREDQQRVRFQTLAYDEVRTSASACAATAAPSQEEAVASPNIRLPAE